MLEKFHLVVIFVTGYHISLSPWRHQTVSPGEASPEEGNLKKVTLVHLKLLQDGRESSKRHNFIVEISHRHFYLLKYQKRSS